MLTILTLLTILTINDEIIILHEMNHILSCGYQVNYDREKRSLKKLGLQQF